jgi:hypothetical protein
MRIATGIRVDARSISTRTASKHSGPFQPGSPRAMSGGTRIPSKSRAKSDRPSTNVASATKGRSASTMGAYDRSFAAAQRRSPAYENLAPRPTATLPRPGATYRCRPLRRWQQPDGGAARDQPHRGRPTQRRVQPKVQMQRCPRRLPQLVQAPRPSSPTRTSRHDPTATLPADRPHETASARSRVVAIQMILTKPVPTVDPLRGVLLVGGDRI